METAYRRIAVAAKNTDTREHDIADSDDYYQYHGGMVATVRALTGTAPAAYIGDRTRPETVRTRTLVEETSRVFRARVVNPRWIEAMRRHGYKGAFELAATVDYLFGYDATTGVVADWMYEKLDPDLRPRPREPRVPRAGQPLGPARHAERLLEAVDRGMWESPSRASTRCARRTWRPRGTWRRSDPTVYVIGIGTGNPDHLTFAGRRRDEPRRRVLHVDKGESTADLAGLRADLLARHVTGPRRVVTAPEVPRDRDPAAYVAGATGRRAGGALRGDDQRSWPTADRRLPRLGRPVAVRQHAQPPGRDRRAGAELDIVSSPASARRRTRGRAPAHLNRVGEPILITTGRRLADGGMPRESTTWW